MNKLKRLIWIHIGLALVILTSCGVSNGTENHQTDGETVITQPEEPAYESPIYAFDSVACSDRYVREDTGEESAVYNYKFPVLSVVNAESLTDADRESVQRNVAVFNQRMSELMEEFVAHGKKLIESQKELVETENVSFAVCDEVIGVPVQMGQIISVVTHCYFYSGGVHPSSFTVTYTFDLSVGQFIDPTQVADDPEAFRVAAADLLVVHAESLGEEYVSGFWTDYRDIITRWNETSVIFEESGMTVIFSAYELGPYALGPVELKLSYEELIDAIGDGGLYHLGVLNESE